MTIGNPVIPLDCDICGKHTEVELEESCKDSDCTSVEPPVWVGPYYLHGWDLEKKQTICKACYEKEAEVYIVKVKKRRKQKREAMAVLQQAEQTLLNLAHGELQGDARQIALNEAANLNEARGVDKS